MKITSVIILICLSLSIAIYTLYRPVDVGMCRVVAYVAGMDTLVAWRSAAPSNLPQWIIYSLPGALWSLSALLATGLATRSLPLWWRRGALGTIISVPLGMEAMQYFGWTDGTYDPVDIWWVSSSAVVAFVALRVIDAKGRPDFDWRWVMAFFLLILFFGDEWTYNLFVG